MDPVKVGAFASSSGGDRASSRPGTIGDACAFGASDAYRGDVRCAMRDARRRADGAAAVAILRAACS
ncbi:hypothetical protein DIE08_09565 [Burkholderia sp. Bp9004]|nr:hypothetical protein DIE08_09565 [Burkholderia sp. Bp9004]